MWRAIRYGLDGRLLDLEAPRDRGVPRRGGARPAATRGPASDVAPARAQRRPAPAPHDRRRRDARGGVRRVRAGDPGHITTAGGDRAHEPAVSSPRRSCAQLEAEMERITVDDVLLQTIVTLLNLAARKAGLGAPPGEEPERDWEQVRQAIEGARALLPLLEPRHGEQLGPVRDTLSRLQMVYAQQRGRRPRPAPPASRPAEPPPPKPGDAGPGAALRAPLDPRPVSAPTRSTASLATLPPLPAAAPTAAAAAFACVQGARTACVREEPDSSEVSLSDFLADHGVVVALVCALRAVVYGVVTSRSLLALSPGNETMRALSAAIQEGASAYLRRQYTTIAHRRRRPVRRADPAPEHRGRDRLRDRRPRSRRRPASSA